MREPGRFAYAAHPGIRGTGDGERLSPGPLGEARALAPHAEERRTRGSNRCRAFARNRFMNPSHAGPYRGLGADAHLQSRTGPGRTGEPAGPFARGLRAWSETLARAGARAEISASARRERGRIDAHAGALRGGHRDALQIGALRAGRLGPAHRIGEGADVLAGAPSSVNDALPTPACTMPAFSTRNSTEPPLASLHRLRHVVGHRADLRVRHQAARARGSFRAGRPAASCPASRCSGRN